MFGFLIHADVPAVFQLFEAIYRPQHFYVFHIDARKTDIRKELEKELNRQFPDKVNNVRIIPLERSSVPAWGSYGIVYGQLAIYEELLRMSGDWEFAIYMSGADLPLRDVEEMALTLAPYRGHSFFGNFDNDYQNRGPPKDLNDMGMHADACWTCDGFTFNVTRANGPPPFTEIRLRGASQWATLSRSMVEHLLDQTTHSTAWKRHMFRFTTIGISDEFMVSSFAVNSKLQAKVHRRWNLVMAFFQNRNAFNLGRHLDEADFGGQGPGHFSMDEYQARLESNNLQLIARKFPTSDTEDPVRKQVLYDVLEKPLEMRASNSDLLNSLESIQNVQALLDELSLRAVEKHLVKGNRVIGRFERRPLLKTDHFSMIPTLVCDPGCCKVYCDNEDSISRPHDLIIQFDSEFEDGSRESMIARWKFNHPTACFGFGHLRRLSVVSPLNHPIPATPYPLSNSRSLQLDFQISVKELNNLLNDTHNTVDVPENQCFEEIVKGRPIRTNGTDNPINIRLNLMNPDGQVIDSADHKLVLHKDKFQEVKIFGHEFVGFREVLDLQLKFDDPGQYILDLHQLDVENPRHYQVQLTHLGSNFVLRNDRRLLDAAIKPWQLDEVKSIPSENPDSHSLTEFHRNQTIHFMVAEKPVRVCGNVKQWLICGGGLLTAVIVAQFIYHLIPVKSTSPTAFPAPPTPMSLKAVFNTMGLILVTTAIQSLLCIRYC